MVSELEAVVDFKMGTFENAESLSLLLISFVHC